LVNKTEEEFKEESKNFDITVFYWL